MANALDGAGLSRALFVLIPFKAYFTFGRTIALALAAVVLAGAVAMAPPGWHRDPEYVSDLLMFAIGLVLALAMAAATVTAHLASTLIPRRPRPRRASTRSPPAKSRSSA